MVIFCVIFLDFLVKALPRWEFVTVLIHGTQAADWREKCLFTHVIPIWFEDFGVVVNLPGPVITSVEPELYGSLAKWLLASNQPNQIKTQGKGIAKEAWKFSIMRHRCSPPTGSWKQVIPIPRFVFPNWKINFRCGRIWAPQQASIPSPFYRYKCTSKRFVHPLLSECKWRAKIATTSHTCPKIICSVNLSTGGKVVARFNF